MSAGGQPRVGLGSLPTELHALIARLIYLDSIPSGSLSTLDPLTLPSSNPLADGCSSSSSSSSSSSRPLASNQAETRRSLYALCLTSRSFYVAARPLLFRRVVITLPYSFLLVMRTLGAAHLAQLYDKYAASGNQDFLLRPPSTTAPMPAPAAAEQQHQHQQQHLGSEAGAGTTTGQPIKRKRDRTVTFEEMVAAAGFAHAAGGTLVVKARSRAAIERPLGRASVTEPGAAAAVATVPQSTGSAFVPQAEDEREIDLVWVEDPSSKSKSKRYHVHLAPFKPTALTLSNEELFAAHRFVRVIDFSRYTSQGMRRSVGDVSKNRFVTPAKLLALITAVSEFLESFGASETMDSALTCEVLEALLFRDGEWAKPSHLRGVSIERRRSKSRHRATSLTRFGTSSSSSTMADSEHKMLQSLDLCNCVSPRFGEALTRFVQLYLRPRAVGITAGDLPTIEPPSGPLEMHEEEEDTTTATETETETETETDTDDGLRRYVRGRTNPMLAAAAAATAPVDGVDRSLNADDDEDESFRGRGRDTIPRRGLGLQSASGSRSRATAGAPTAPSVASPSTPRAMTSALPSISATAAAAAATAPRGGSTVRLTSPAMRRTSSITRSASRTRSRSTAFTPAVFPSLKRLGLNGITFPMDIITPFVMAFPNLTHLDLSRTKTDGGLLRLLAASDTLALRSLSLARCRSVDSESVLELIVRSDVCAGLVELSLEGTLIFPTPLTRQDAMTLIREAPSIKSGAMRHLDLSGCGLTDEHLSAFAVQPSMLDLGLGCNPRITLGGVATLLKEKAPNVQILDLQDSCTATSDEPGYEDDEGMGDGPPVFGTASGAAITAASLHQLLLGPCCLPPPVPLSQQLAMLGFKHYDGSNSSSSSASAAAAAAAAAADQTVTASSMLGPPRPPTNLRVIELGTSSLRSIRNGIDSWKVIWGAGQRGWIVDMAAGPNPQAVFQSATAEAAAAAAASAAAEGRRGRSERSRRGRGPSVYDSGRDLSVGRAGGGGGGGSRSRRPTSLSQSRSRSRARSTSRVRAPGRTVSLDTDEEDEAFSSADDDDDDGDRRGRSGRNCRFVREDIMDEEQPAAAATGEDVTLGPASAPSSSSSALAVVRNEIVRNLPESHPRRKALEALGQAKGHVPGDTGWHSRKMEILLGFGFMGREAGSYAMVAYQT